MKLLNQSLKYLSVSILVIISLWAVGFYFNMLNEIRGSVDEGLENYKRQIIYNAQTDSTVLAESYFSESFYKIREIDEKRALTATDRYMDTLMFMQDADDEAMELEPIRMLTTVFENEGKYYELSIINSMVEEDDLIKELFYDTLWLYVILVVSIVIINNVILKRLWKPFYDLLNQLKNYRIDKSPTLPQANTTTKEFIDLQNALNTLLLRNIETYEQQKQFIGNASHELQTPLAIITSKLELLLEKEELEHSQAESIAQVLQTIERLIRLNKSLLLLTKIENKQFINHEVISLNEVTKECVDDLTEFADYKNVTISLHETTELFVQMDATLANIIVSNLIKNAIFHNVQNGSVTIQISDSSIKIYNTGKSHPLDKEKIFTRFYKSEDDTGGTGLGLAIIKAVCGLYDFNISYHFENNMHCFELKISK